jgi:uncharacterized protein YndB with AHSA1/START domain
MTATKSTLEFEVEIAAPVETVWSPMIGRETYARWTAAAGPRALESLRALCEGAR